MKMNHKCFKALGLSSLSFFALGAFLIQLLVMIVQLGPTPRIVTSQAQLTHAPVAIVLGASVLSPTKPSDALHDRLFQGAQLYKQGLVTRVLLTGDGGEFRSDEVSVMALTLGQLGVPREAILLDREGFRTYESCKRAAQVFGIKNAVIVTQRFHLARALFLCEHFGIQVQGISADRQPYLKIGVFATRELLASVKATIDIFLHAPTSPVYLR